MERPKLRHLEISRASTPEGGALALRDPLSVSGKVLVMPEGLGFLLVLLDGENTIAQIQDQVLRHLNKRIETDDLFAFVHKLDDALFLDNERFRDAVERVVASFSRLRTRPAALAGMAYEADADRLREWIDGIFGNNEGAGGAAASGPRQGAEGTGVRAVLAPHIDLARGAESCAWSYRTVAERTDADLFVVLGVAHQPMANLYAPLDMSYETPLGTVEVDRGFMASLRGKTGLAQGADLLAHRSEHSIEFQAVLLQYALGGRREFRIAPILCSSLCDLVARGQAPSDAAPVNDFVLALREAVEESGRRVCFIGGVDFAHIGRKFGHLCSSEEYGYERIEAEDRALIETILSGDAEAFYAEAMKDGDARNVCGLPAIYALLRVAEADGGELLHYGQAKEPDTGSVVTFASVALR